MERVDIKVINMANGEKTVMAQQVYTLQDGNDNNFIPVGVEEFYYQYPPERDEAGNPIYDDNENFIVSYNRLASQRPMQEELILWDENNEEVGRVRYQATWIYNREEFLHQLKISMQVSVEELKVAINTNNRKLKQITEPLGGYRNVLELDDVYLEDDQLLST